MDYYYNLLKSAQKNAVKSEKKVKELSSFTDSTKAKPKTDHVDPEAVRKFLEKSKEKEEQFQKALKEKLKAQEEKRKQERLMMLRKKGLLKEEPVEPQKPSQSFLPPNSEFQAYLKTKQSSSVPSSDNHSKEYPKPKHKSSNEIQRPPPKPISYTFEDMMKAAQKNMESPFEDHLKAAMLGALNGGAKKRPSEEVKHQPLKSSREDKDGPPPIKKTKRISDVTPKADSHNNSQVMSQMKTKRPASTSAVPTSSVPSKQSLSYESSSKSSNLIKSQSIPKVSESFKVPSVSSSKPVGIAAQQSTGKVRIGISNSGKTFPQSSFTTGIAAQQSTGKVRIPAPPSREVQSVGIAAQLSNSKIAVPNSNVPKQKQISQPVKAASGTKAKSSLPSQPPSKKAPISAQSSTLKSSSSGVVTKPSLPPQKQPPKNVALTGIAAQLGVSGVSRAPSKHHRYYSDEDDDDYDDDSDFIDDSEVPDGLEFSKVVKTIHQTMKFDPSKYAAVRPWDDCRDMESNFTQIEKEEKRSLRLARQEDLEEEKRLEMMTRKK